jgi:alpha-galactosidase
MPVHVVLLGAGSVSFTRGLVADLARTGWEVDLRLVDIDPEALRVAEGLARKTAQAAGARMTVAGSTDSRELLPGADAVICTIAVGGRRAWEQDVLVPRRYGIYQPVGDTTMPGGLSRALRMIPAMIDIARDVLELCPGARFFNYSNPMTAVCRAVRKATGADVTGLCHGVVHVARYLAEFLDVPVSELAYTAVGLNHLTWFTELRRNGRDAWPAVRDRLARTAAVARDNSFSWELFERYGAFPAVLDRHVSEFFPQFFRDGSYYGKTLGVDAFSVEECIERGDEGYARMRELALSPDPLPDSYLDGFGGEHEQVVDILDSILTDAGRVYSANVPNARQVANLPRDAVIECPAAATAQGMRPVDVGALPSGLAATLVSHLAVVETIVDAALQGSRDLFVQALVADGSVASLDVASRLADDLLAAHADHLPQF